MNLWIIAACLAFAISFAMMLYFNKVFWYKLLTVTLTFVIANMVYFSLDSVKGWPSHQKITKGQLVFVSILEPVDSYPGAIYVYVIAEPVQSKWYDEFVKYVYWDQNAPRSYYIKYTKQSSEQMRAAQQAMEQGYIVEISGDSAEAQNGDAGDNNNNGNAKEGASYQQDGNQVDYDVPHLQLVDPRTRSGKVKQ